MIENTANLKARDAIKIKRIGNSRNRNIQTHRQANTNFPKKVIIITKTSIKRRSTKKGTL